MALLSATHHPLRAHPPPLAVDKLDISFTADGHTAHPAPTETAATSNEGESTTLLPFCVMRKPCPIRITPLLEKEVCSSECFKEANIEILNLITGSPYLTKVFKKCFWAAIGEDYGDKLTTLKFRMFVRDCKLIDEGVSISAMNIMFQNVTKPLAYMNETSFALTQYFLATLLAPKLQEMLTNASASLNGSARHDDFLTADENDATPLTRDLRAKRPSTSGGPLTVQLSGGKSIAIVHSSSSSEAGDDEEDDDSAHAPPSPTMSPLQQMEHYARRFLEPYLKTFFPAWCDPEVWWSESDLSVEKVLYDYREPLKQLFDLAAVKRGASQHRPGSGATTPRVGGSKRVSVAGGSASQDALEFSAKGGVFLKAVSGITGSVKIPAKPTPASATATPRTRAAYVPNQMSEAMLLQPAPVEKLKVPSREADYGNAGGGPSMYVPPRPLPKNHPQYFSTGSNWTATMPLVEFSRFVSAARLPNVSNGEILRAIRASAFMYDNHYLRRRLSPHQKAKSEEEPFLLFPEFCDALVRLAVVAYFPTSLNTSEATADGTPRSPKSARTLSERNLSSSTMQRLRSVRARTVSGIRQNERESAVKVCRTVTDSLRFVLDLHVKDVYHEATGKEFPSSITPGSPKSTTTAPGSPSHLSSAEAVDDAHLWRYALPLPVVHRLRLHSESDVSKLGVNFLNSLRGTMSLSSALTDYEVVLTGTDFDVDKGLFVALTAGTTSEGLREPLTQFRCYQVESSGKTASAVFPTFVDLMTSAERRRQQFPCRLIQYAARDAGGVCRLFRSLLHTVHLHFSNDGRVWRSRYPDLTTMVKASAPTRGFNPHQILYEEILPVATVPMELYQRLHQVIERLAALNDPLNPGYLTEEKWSIIVEQVQLLLAKLNTDTPRTISSSATPSSKPTAPSSASGRPPPTVLDLRPVATDAFRTYCGLCGSPPEPQYRDALSTTTAISALLFLHQHAFPLVSQKEEAVRLWFTYLESVVSRLATFLGAPEFGVQQQGLVTSLSQPTMSAQLDPASRLGLGSGFRMRNFVQKQSGRALPQQSNKRHGMGSAPGGSISSYREPSRLVQELSVIVARSRIVLDVYQGLLRIGSIEATEGQKVTDPVGDGAGTDTAAVGVGMVRLKRSGAVPEESPRSARLNTRSGKSPYLTTAGFGISDSYDRPQSARMHFLRTGDSAQPAWDTFPHPHLSFTADAVIPLQGFARTLQLQLGFLPTVQRLRALGIHFLPPRRRGSDREVLGLRMWSIKRSPSHFGSEASNETTAESVPPQLYSSASQGIYTTAPGKTVIPALGVLATLPGQICTLDWVPVETDLVSPIASMCLYTIPHQSAAFASIASVFLSCNDVHSLREGIMSLGYELEAVHPI
jgi:hypothetical protein